MNRPRQPLTFHRPIEEAAFYGVSDVAIRRWKRTGRLKNDPFPTHDPVEVLRWYQRHHTKGIPTRLVEAAQKWSGKDMPLSGLSLPKGGKENKIGQIRAVLR